MNPSPRPPAGHLSALDIDAIEARAAAATEGPWTFYGDDLWHGASAAELQRADQLYAIDGVPYSDEAEEILERSGRLFHGDVVHSADAEFIAHARTDVVDLAAAVRRVLELHQPSDQPDELLMIDCPDRPEGDCQGHDVICCSRCVGYHPDDSMLATPVPWPCPTVRALGIGS